MLAVRAIPPMLQSAASGVRRTMAIRKLLRRFKPWVPARLRAWARALPRVEGYERRRAEEIERFAADVDVHALPPIFHYWSHNYLRPVFESFGFGYPEDFYARWIERERARLGRAVRVLSIGAGNCDCEVRVAKLLRDRGIADGTFECLDLTAAMLERGRELAAAEGVAEAFTFVVADFNEWVPGRRPDVVMANQCLHHVVELERLFSRIDHAIVDGGVFLTSDMIGRNGHQRWPEARAIVDRFWEELPDSYRWNRQLQRGEKRFLDWDCSVEGFEGVRAQDILPLLVQRFDFELFVAFGNVIDPFVDRSFGPNFDADAAWDRDFIDRVHAADDAAIDAGTITPTHMVAAMRRRSGIVPRVYRQRTPERCVRVPD